MFKIYPEQLKIHINTYGLKHFYLISGNESLLIQESIKIIRSISITEGFEEDSSIFLDKNIDWNNLLEKFSSLNLFCNKKIAIFYIMENKINTVMEENLLKLFSIGTKNNIIILNIQKLTTFNQQSTLFKIINQQGVCIICNSPKKNQLLNWVISRTKDMNIKIDDAAVKLLCSLYECNLSALILTLERCILVWPNRKLTISLIKKTIEYTSNFTVFNWIDELLEGKIKKSLYILHQLKKEKIEISILLRVLQKDLLKLLNIHRNKDNYPLNTLINQQCIWQNRKMLFVIALKRLDIFRLNYAVRLLAQTELIVKYNNDQNAWLKLEKISLLLCYSNFPVDMRNNNA